MKGVPVGNRVLNEGLEGLRRGRRKEDRVRGSKAPGLAMDLDGCFRSPRKSREQTGWGRNGALVQSPLAFMPVLAPAAL